MDFGTLNVFLIYTVLGAFAGTMAGLLGVGGGLVIVPVLAWIFTGNGMNPAIIMHLAVGTSLATIVFTSVSSVRAHHRRGGVRWDLFRRLTPGIVLGAWLGAVIADRLPTSALRIIFGVFGLVVALQMGFSIFPASGGKMPGKMGMSGVGVVIGAVSSLVGIGGGILTVSFLVWSNLDMRRAVATSAAVGMPIAIAGAIGFLANGWGSRGLPPGAVGYVYLPALAGVVGASVLFAPLGARLAHSLPTNILKRFFALFLAVLGVRMLFF